MQVVVCLQRGLPRTPRRIQLQEAARGPGQEASQRTLAQAHLGNLFDY
jgi:hypothetical protein